MRPLFTQAMSAIECLYTKGVAPHGGILRDDGRRATTADEVVRYMTEAWLKELVLQSGELHAVLLRAEEHAIAAYSPQQERE